MRNDYRHEEQLRYYADIAKFVERHGFDARVTDYGVTFDIPWLDVNTGERGEERHGVSSYRAAKRALGY